MSTYVLAFTSGPIAGRRIAIADRVLRIGRGGGCDVAIEHRGIAAEHAELRADAAGHVTLRRLTPNTILVDDQPIDREATLRPGSVIELAPGIQAALRPARGWFARTPPAAAPDDAARAASATPTPGERIRQLLWIGIPVYAAAGLVWLFIATRTPSEGFIATDAAFATHVTGALTTASCRAGLPAGDEGTALGKRFEEHAKEGLAAEMRADWGAAVRQYEQARLVMNDPRCDAVRYVAVRLDAVRARAARIRGAR